MMKTRKKMKVIIAGSRHMAHDMSLLSCAIARAGWEITEVVCGLAKGADTWGKYWAQYYNIPVKEFPADWEKYGKAAGVLRNKQMADYADTAIVFIWDNSRGSKNMIDTMQKLGKPVYIVNNGVIT